MDYEMFKKEFYALTTINLDLYKEKQMKRRISTLIEKKGFKGFEDFFLAIKTDKNLYDAFINYLTINVSEFYRNPAQWKILKEEIIPIILKNKGTKKEIFIWSSACSTGDEPYTLAMILLDILPKQRIKILATDIDTGAIDKAKDGIYPARSIRGLPKKYLEAYFSKIESETYIISDQIKKIVEFKRLDLLKDTYPKEQDLIVCRNVLIYFTDEAKKTIYKRFNQSLVKNGILFLGSTEQIIGSQVYGLKPIKTFFYQKINETI